MAETFDFSPDCSRWDTISLCLVLPGLWPYLPEVSLYLCTVRVGIPPLCTLSSHSASMLGCFLP
jgi:hypothetical protein